MILWTFAFGSCLTILLLAVGHWFPWPKRLSRIQAYIYGVTCITGGFSLWRLLNGDWLTPIGLWLLAIGGGIVVVGAYWIDDLVIRLRKADKGEQVIHDRIPKP